MATTTSTHAQQTVHLIPRGDHWVMIGVDGTENGTTFPDLGTALDQATSGDELVHVVVHTRPNESEDQSRACA